MGIKLIVGLANPGPQYQATRHNAGRWFVDYCAEKARGDFKSAPKFKSWIASITINTRPCTLLIPNSYMNQSGQSVALYSHFYQIPPENILIAHDELDFPVGQLRLKLAGGHGGHNGLRDIIEKLGTHAFYRLRIGIGRPVHKEDVSDYVLSAPSVLDKTRMIDACAAAFGTLPLLVNDTISAPLNQDII